MPASALPSDVAASARPQNGSAKVPQGSEATRICTGCNEEFPERGGLMICPTCKKLIPRRKAAGGASTPGSKLTKLALKSTGKRREPAVAVAPPVVPVEPAVVPELVAAFVPEPVAEPEPVPVREPVVPEPIAEFGNEPVVPEPVDEPAFVAEAAAEPDIPISVVQPEPDPAPSQEAQAAPGDSAATESDWDDPPDSPTPPPIPEPVADPDPILLTAVKEEPARRPLFAGRLPSSSRPPPRPRPRPRKSQPVIAPVAPTPVVALAPPVAPAPVVALAPPVPPAPVETYEPQAPEQDNAAIAAAPPLSAVNPYDSAAPAKATASGWDNDPSEAWAQDGSTPGATAFVVFAYIVAVGGLVAALYFRFG